MAKLNRAHADLIARLSNLRPSTIRGSADLIDAENRADYLKEVFSTVNAFFDAVVTDTVDHLPGISRVNRDKVEVAVWDLMNADVVDVGHQLDWAGCHLGGIRAAA